MPAPPLASSSRSQDAGSSSSSRAPPAASSNQAGSAAAPGRPAKSSQPPPAPSSGARSRAPSSASGGGGGGGGGGPTTRPRAQSNVGAKLLKKRQSVAYNQHPGLFATADGQVTYPPAVPAIPQGLATTAGPASSSSAGPPRPLAAANEAPPDHQHASSSNKSSTSRQAPAPVVRTDAEKQLLAKGLDVDQLASDSFKPEDCKRRAPRTTDIFLADKGRFMQS